MNVNRDARSIMDMQLARSTPPSLTRTSITRDLPRGCRSRLRWLLKALKRRLNLL